MMVEETFINKCTDIDRLIVECKCISRILLETDDKEDCKKLIQYLHAIYLRLNILAG
jgi:hypothetical protein